ncbi:MAG: 2-oxoglutarate dehydrogenase complex dihydrolipoyllysine-residue succinyltransferase [Chloroflexi bacterium]|nr:MAG: 2-oxoglutarate dehydrogenase complex dihydrolipoyllysine-residue succinyltransferase [Chloroflexota bacterium]
MASEIIVPELGESILDATVAQWLKEEGDPVELGEALVELETDKVNVEVSARQSGILARINHREHEDVKVGDVLGIIEEADGAESAQRMQDSQDRGAEMRESVREEVVQPERASEAAAEDEKEELPAPEGGPEITPVARRYAVEQGVDLTKIHGTGPGGRVTKADIESHLSSPEKSGEPVEKPAPPKPAAPRMMPREEQPAVLPAANGRREDRVKMSRRRRTIAQRLVEIQQTAAILSTFNEIDMTAVMDLRSRRNEEFQKRYGIKIGFMSFFVKAVIGALKAFPRLNAEVQEDEMVIKHYFDIGIAIGAEEGLVVPVLRNADQMTFAEIEKKIEQLAQKTREGNLTLEDLRGGTFSITNGGVFGSLLSTPILTPPQVGILGMHKIEKRPVAVGDEVVIRPMMYVALSYDHRIVDGREAVLFLVRVKELIEDPETLLLEG